MLFNSNNIRNIFFYDIHNKKKYKKPYSSIKFLLLDISKQIFFYWIIIYFKFLFLLIFLNGKNKDDGFYFISSLLDLTF